MGTVATGAAYEPRLWESFAVAEVGAAAALAGLLVVACSINLARIMEIPAVLSRLAATLLLFTTVLVVGTLLLVPDQSAHLVGAEIAVVGAIAVLVVIRQRTVRKAEPEFRRSTAIATMSNLVAAAALTVGGLACAFGVLGGLYWIVPGVVLGFAIGLANAWVALVEILR